MERLLKALIKRVTYFAHRLQYNREERDRFRLMIKDLSSQVVDEDKLLIIANGPSINKTDLKKYHDYKIVTMNRAYVKWGDLGLNDIFFHVCINQLVVTEFAEELSDLPCATFLSYSAARNSNIKPKKNIIFLMMGFFIGDRVSNSISAPFSSSGTVTFVALNLALLLGFKEIVLVGVDHNFQSAGPPNKTTTQVGADHNHFFDDYFPKGMKWELPDLDRSEKGYRLIRTAAERLGVRIIDHTVDGRLSVFEKG
jgi:hypothetical protein